MYRNGMMPLPNLCRRAIRVIATLCVFLLPLGAILGALLDRTPPIAQADSPDDYVLSRMFVSGDSYNSINDYEGMYGASEPPTQSFTMRYEDVCGLECSEMADVSLRIQVPRRIARNGRYTVSATAHEILATTGDVYYHASGQFRLYVCGDLPSESEHCVQSVETGVQTINRTVSRDLSLQSVELVTSDHSNPSHVYVEFRASAWFFDQNGTSQGGFAEVAVQVFYDRCGYSEGCNTVEGTIRTESPSLPLNGVEVAVLRDGKIIGRGTTQSPGGRFSIPNVPVTTTAVIRISLQNQASVPSPFRVMYGGAAGPLAEAVTQPLDITAGPPVHRDVVLGDRLDMDQLPDIPRNKVNDLGVIYYHTHQAWELTERVGQRLDFKLPVDIRAFSDLPGAAYWKGPMTDGANAAIDPYINYEAASGNSASTSPNRPNNREWHEFGHHVMADTFGNLMPSVAGDSNHGGYGNPTTTDSWTEGFAEFYSTMVGREIAGDARPELYRWAGQLSNLEANWRAWNDEEFALAGLLLDVVDPADADDATVLNGVSYADCVQMSLNDFWTLFRALWDKEVPRPPAATADFPYIFDVKMLYDVLKRQGVGAAPSRGGALSDLDELFVSHGFFADTNGNKRYDIGEEIGRAAYPARPGRRARPPKQGSYVAFDARTAQTGAAHVHTFTVDVRFAPPFEQYSYSYEQDTTQTPGRLYYVGPDPQYQATTYITARGDGTESRTPLTVSNSAYWTEMAKNPTDSFTQHTFEMVPKSRVFLPFVVRDANMASLFTSSTAGVRAANVHIARACAPVTGSPTPTPTVTSTTSPTITGTPGTPIATWTVAPSTTVVTPTATRTATATPTSTRTATPIAHAVTVDQTWTTGTDDAVRMAFAAGETVKLWIKVTNGGSSSTSAQLTWDVFNQWGGREDRLSGSDARSIPPGTTSFALQKTVPGDVWAGSYTVVGTATSGGQSSARPADLFLAQSLRLADDFSNPASGWGAADTADYSVGYVGGEYRILVKSGGHAIRVAGPNTRMTEDLVVEADVRPVSNTTDHYGLLLGEGDNSSHFDAVWIYRDGTYRVSQYDGGWQDLISRTAASALKTGQTANHLTAVVRGPTISVYANGVWLADTNDALFPASAAQGLIVSTPDANAEVRFDNFRLYGLEGALPGPPIGPGGQGGQQAGGEQSVVDVVAAQE